MTGTSKYHLPAGSSADGPYELLVTPESAGWGYSGLRILTLKPGEAHALSTRDCEFLVLPLTGSCTVTTDGMTFELAGRTGVFASTTDFVYLPRESEALIGSADGGTFALPAARTERSSLSARYGPKENVPVELRGAGACSRQVNNYCLPGTFEAEQLLVCEVLTPGGNWSSYPPHKHDEARPGAESELEEIYYFQVSGDGNGFGYQRVYGTPGRPIDVLAEVRSGDTVLIPHGWHGPSIAAPGYDLYYLNVMAGPGQDRAWLICDDPAHGWVRTTWDTQDIDDRLPFGAEEKH
ncbi:5-deoxy-glucuronate isomerase [Streptomyces europaeiscabiei]|uniref:5-deoxy-glucuronate isomerase n=1 Tax=Streptomyces europaeiscabiei TaxID=146819 RepID=UPI0029BB5D3E|nr:5-deoxy-glucuronate isomerase [Streptomyces europaeiscabiei]MDX2524853.1 5-deoxy-glucuronate isomerase [Streptomyces europaeiscabiei]MDX2771212.1 5-deoxy-glucuronate isomerase [Streptomyces europaeiscabiei]MDX3673027.1 5-deoxy-glucuronate isomerase [Streptomyces europaeiscabiei]MDX3715396.1 5-deoxy-glucuronate isomerase [Streptomyces europaeiscabiei]MDX3866189.1 5-deoxy-glucuronate isomerase [Streptomyces europaeiscabiei]